MKTKIVFIERKFWEFVSIEKVFGQIAESLSSKKFDYHFEKLRFGNNLKGIIKNLITYKPKNADIFHITGHIHYLALTLPRDKTILTIHDLGFLHNNKGFKRYIIKKLFLDLPVKKLKYVTTISQATKDEIVFYTNCDINKVRVIENPLPEYFFSKKKKEFNEKCPTILQVGTSENKNVPNLLKAIQGISCKLEIIGKLDDKLIELLEGYNINYTNSFNLDDSELIEKYETSDIVTFCSNFEGFGLPIIEAQAMQKPLITSNISPLKDVAGKAAILINPNKPKQIKEGIIKLVKNKDLRDKLVHLGLENIKRYDSKNIAKKYEKLYEEVLNQN